LTEFFDENLVLKDDILQIQVGLKRKEPVKNNIITGFVKFQISDSRFQIKRPLRIWNPELLAF